MTETPSRSLKVFLCHARADKPKVRELYRYLRKRGIRPRFDEVDLVGGQDWQVEIPKALATSDAIIKCQKGGFFLSQYGLKNVKFRASQLERATVELPKTPAVVEQKNLVLKGEQESIEQAVRESAEREAKEKAKRERVERESAEKVAREKTKRDAIEKAKREKAERQAAQRAALKESIPKSFSALKSALPNAKPFLRISGIIGIIIILFWGGSWALPEFISLIPTARASVTQPPGATIAFTSTSAPIVETVEPNTTPTKTRTPVPTALPTEITDAKGVEMVLVASGDFMMGSANGNSDEKPVHEVYLDAFYIDKYEATNALSVLHES